jgi:hypothetical protein
MALFRYGDAGVEDVTQHDVAEHQHHHQRQQQGDHDFQRAAVAVDQSAHEALR